MYLQIPYEFNKSDTAIAKALKVDRRHHVAEARRLLAAGYTTYVDLPVQSTPDQSDRSGIEPCDLREPPQPTASNTVTIAPPTFVTPLRVQIPSARAVFDPAATPPHSLAMLSRTANPTDTEQVAPVAPESADPAGSTPDTGQIAVMRLKDILHHAIILRSALQIVPMPTPDTAQDYTDVQTMLYTELQGLSQDYSTFLNRRNATLQEQA